MFLNFFGVDGQSMHIKYLRKTKYTFIMSYLRAAGQNLLIDLLHFFSTVTLFIVLIIIIIN